MIGTLMCVVFVHTISALAQARLVAGSTLCTTNGLTWHFLGVSVYVCLVFCMCQLCV